MTDNADKTCEELQSILKLYKSFLLHFEQVFHDDWHFTKYNILNPLLINDNRTFLCPLQNIQDEDDNWANRGNLLTAYRQLKIALGETPASMSDPGLLIDSHPVMCPNCGRTKL